MKKTIINSAIFLLLFTSTTIASGCDTAYMKDSCAVDGYEIVEIERFVKGIHNQMNDVHFFNTEKSHSRKKTKKKKKRYSKTKKHYKYIKKCRLVKVVR